MPLLLSCDAHAQVLQPSYSGLVAAQAWARNESARRQQSAAQQEWREARNGTRAAVHHAHVENRGSEMVQRR